MSSRDPAGVGENLWQSKPVTRSRSFCFFVKLTRAFPPSPYIYIRRLEKKEKPFYDVLSQPIHSGELSGISVTATFQGLRFFAGYFEVLIESRVFSTPTRDISFQSIHGRIIYSNTAPTKVTASFSTRTFYLVNPCSVFPTFPLTKFV